jgi:hypothetical protein
MERGYGGTSYSLAPRGIILSIARSRLQKNPVSARHAAFIVGSEGDVWAPGDSNNGVTNILHKKNESSGTEITSCAYV